MSERGPTPPGFEGGAGEGRPQPDPEGETRVQRTPAAPGARQEPVREPAGAPAYEPAGTTAYESADEVIEPHVRRATEGLYERIRSARSLAVAGLLLSLIAGAIAVFALLSQGDDGSSRSSQASKLEDEVDRQRARNEQQAETVKTLEERLDDTTKVQRRLAQRVEDAEKEASSSGDTADLERKVSQAQSDAERSSSQVDSLRQEIQDLARQTR